MKPSVMCQHQNEDLECDRHDYCANSLTSYVVCICTDATVQRVGVPHSKSIFTPTPLLINKRTVHHRTSQAT
jgi:hypothetical protein